VRAGKKLRRSTLAQGKGRRTRIEGVPYSVETSRNITLKQHNVSTSVMAETRRDGSGRCKVLERARKKGVLEGSQGTMSGCVCLRKAGGKGDGVTAGNRGVPTTKERLVSSNLLITTYRGLRWEKGIGGRYMEGSR